MYVVEDKTTGKFAKSDDRTFTSRFMGEVVWVDSLNSATLFTEKWADTVSFFNGGCIVHEIKQERTILETREGRAK